MNKMMSVDEIITDYNRYKSFYKKGGITVSGGEPLLQMKGLIELFKKAKEERIHTCLDTSAACFSVKASEDFKALMSLTDLVLLDIKHINNEKHLKLTGSSNTHVLDFARFLDELNVNVIIRHVLVPTITDDPHDLRQLRSFLDTLSNVSAIEILPYHTKGITKWKELGFTYPLPEIKEPTFETIEQAETILKHEYRFRT